MDVDVVEVTSVSRQTRPLAETAAAAFVISAEDIRRSGATNIPEALRMAPGVEVARIDANKWAVSIRGSNGRFSDKLLVMIDGMSVYMPFSCNVFWDTQDIPLDDIARIEVIRGPGGSHLGRQRRQRRHQHHHQARQGHSRHVRVLGRRLAAWRLRDRPLRRADRPADLLPRVRERAGLRRQRPRQRRRHRRGRRLEPETDRLSPGYQDRCGRPDHPVGHALPGRLRHDRHHRAVR